MRCFHCDNRDAQETVYAPTEVPDKFKIRCFRCEGALSEKQVKKLLQDSDPNHVDPPPAWIPPPLPPTRKEEERMKREQEELQRREEEERARLEWEEQHETTSFNILVKPPIIFGGDGEKKTPMLHRIFSSSINDIQFLDLPLACEVHRMKQLQKQEKEKKKYRQMIDMRLSGGVQEVTV